MVPNFIAKERKSDNLIPFRLINFVRGKEKIVLSLQTRDLTVMIITQKIILNTLKIQIASLNKITIVSTTENGSCSAAGFLTLFVNPTLLITICLISSYNIQHLLKVMSIGDKLLSPDSIYLLTQPSLYRLLK